MRRECPYLEVTPSRIFEGISASARSALTMAAQPAVSNVCFQFRDCAVTLNATPKKTILHGVSGEVQSGHLLAIMGPSGAGKTTLLNLLSGTKGSSSELRSGRVALNQLPFTSARLACHHPRIQLTGRVRTSHRLRRHVQLVLLCGDATRPLLDVADLPRGAPTRAGLSSGRAEPHRGRVCDRQRPAANWPRLVRGCAHTPQQKPNAHARARALADCGAETAEPRAPHTSLRRRAPLLTCAPRACGCIDSPRSLDVMADLNAGTDDPEEMGSPGLSGGQRRRLSLAVALAKRPALLIADEPTSGLDDAAAAAIMKLFGELAREDCMAVVCTIHQPSASVYAGIGTLLLLTKGRTAYYGPASELIDYVAALGKPVQAGVSVSEHALSLINADFTSDAHVEEVIEAWAKHLAAQLAAKPAPCTAPLPSEPRRATFVRQCEQLFVRHFCKLLPRDPMFVVLMVVLMAIDISWAGLYFWDATRSDDQLSALHKVVFAFCAISFPIGYVSLISIASGFERFRVEREITNGMYSPVSYILVTSTIALLQSYIVGMVSAIMGYVWGNFYWPSVGYAIIINSVSVFWFASFAQLTGWLFGPFSGPLIFAAVFSVTIGALGATRRVARPAPTSAQPSPRCLLPLHARNHSTASNFSFAVRSCRSLWWLLRQHLGDPLAHAHHHV